MLTKKKKPYKGEGFVNNHYKTGYNVAEEVGQLNRNNVINRSIFNAGSFINENLRFMMLMLVIFEKQNFNYINLFLVVLLLHSQPLNSRLKYFMIVSCKANSATLELKYSLVPLKFT